MRKSKITVALGAAAAIAALPLMASSASAGTTGTNSGIAGGHAASSSSAPSTDLAKCKKFKQPTGKYTNKSDALDLSGIPDGTLVSEADGYEFSVEMYKATVPGGGWGSWSSPPDSEDATPEVLWSFGATTVTVSYPGTTKIGGAEVEPNPFEVHTITAVFSKGSKDICTVSVEANGQSGAKLIGVKTKKAWDTVTYSSDVDFAMAQVRG